MQKLQALWKQSLGDAIPANSKSRLAGNLDHEERVPTDQGKYPGFSLLKEDTSCDLGLSAPWLPPLKSGARYILWARTQTRRIRSLFLDNETIGEPNPLKDEVPPTYYL